MIIWYEFDRHIMLIFLKVSLANLCKSFSEASYQQVIFHDMKKYHVLFTRCPFKCEMFSITVVDIDIDYII